VADDSLSDAELIAASWEQPETFEAIFERHLDAVFRYLSVRVGRDDAQDLAGEVFTRAFQARRRFRLEFGSARPWLLGIAANLVRQRARRLRRRERALLRLRSWQPATSDESDELAKRADASAARGQLAAAFATLTSGEREIVALHVFGGLSHSEIARSLHLPVGTVKSRMARALHKLREQIGPEWRTEWSGEAEVHLEDQDG
jgi:RNA polymerase sigma factor (sigma-70 family)